MQRRSKKKRNRVQFQKGLSLRRFLERYGSEEQCAEALFQARWPKVFACGGRQHGRLHTRKVFQCNACKHQVSLTAGTLFAGTQLPLTVWFLAIHLLIQAKHGVVFHIDPSRDSQMIPAAGRAFFK